MFAMGNSWLEFIELTSTFKGLDYAWRYGTIPITVRENVSTHLFWVTHYATLLHLEIDPTDRTTIGAVLLGASLHDTLEKTSGEIVRTFKYLTPELKREIDRAEQIIIDQLPPDAKRLFHTYEMMLSDLGPNGSQYVETLIKVADFIAVFQFMKRELERGNREIDPYYDRMIDDLQMMMNSTPSVLSPRGVTFHPGMVYEAMCESARELIGKYR